jgi:hypothetical protein
MTGSGQLHLSLLSHLQSVVDLDSQVSNRALELGMPKQQLHCSEILRSTIDQGGLGAAQRVRAIGS